MTAFARDRTTHAIPGDCFGTFKLPDEVAFIASRGE
jgi:hypothetical protein